MRVFHCVRTGLLALLLLVCTASTTVAQEGMAYREWPVRTVVTVDNNQAQEAVFVQPGEAIRVELYAASGTGYLWGLSGGDTGFLQQVYTSTSPAGNRRGFAGGPVRTVFILKADENAQGESSAVFLLRRPWEKEETVSESFTLFVTIQKDGFLLPGKTIIRKDAANGDALPDNFRILEDLKASGSSQYSAEELKNVQENLQQEHLILVDLRQEAHGFVYGIPISWYGEHNWANLGKSPAEIAAEESRLLTNLSKEREAVLYKKLKMDKRTGILVAAKQENVEISEVDSEQKLAERLGIGYFRLPVTDHRRPLDGDVDRFIGFIRELPANTWLHFHCEAGHGRTTTFLAMYDMLLHAKRDVLEEIIARQQEAGGIDLFASSKRDWRRPYDEERIAFLKRFYEYCRQNEDHYATSWSEWLDQKNR